jgi:hypothetical protein
MEQTMWSAGYFVTLWKGEPWAGPEGLTVSDCLAHMAPDWWGLGWTSRERDPKAEAVRFGISAEDLPAVQEWASSALDRGDYLVHHVFRTAALAIEFRRRFVRVPARVVGLGFSSVTRARLLDAWSGYYKTADLPGTLELLRAEHPLDATGVTRGFEIVGYVQTGQFESHRCQPLETEFSKRLGVRLNGRGLVDDAVDAERCADYVNSLGSTCASVWLPGCLVEYEA